MPDQDEQARNWAQARERIDSGRTGDKVAASDPASVPLGTDSEAGGDGTPAEHVNRSIRQQESGPPNASTRQETAERRRRRGLTAAVAGVAIALAVIALAFATTS